MMGKPPSRATARAASMPSAPLGRATPLGSLWDMAPCAGELGGGGAGGAEPAGLPRTLAHHCSSTARALSVDTHLIATTAWRWRNQKAPVEGLLERVVAENLVLVSTGGADFLLGSGKAE